MVENSLNLYTTGDRTTERSPLRRRVFFDPPEVLLAKLVARPGRWLLVAGGTYARKPSFAQTAHAVRKGNYAGLPPSPKWIYETRVVSDRQMREDRTYESEFYIRLVLLSPSDPDPEMTE